MNDKLYHRDGSQLDVGALREVFATSNSFEGPLHKSEHRTGLRLDLGAFGRGDALPCSMTKAL